MARYMSRLAWSVVLLAAAKSSASEVPSEHVAACELAKQPGRWSGRQVATTGLVDLEAPAFFLYDQRCNSHDAWIALDASEESTKNLELLSILQGRGARVAKVDIAGRFSAPSGSGYGPLSQFRMQISVDLLSSAEAAARNARLPDSGSSAPLSDAETEIASLEALWLSKPNSEAEIDAAASLDRETIWIASDWSFSQGIPARGGDPRPHLGVIARLSRDKPSATMTTRTKVLAIAEDLVLASSVIGFYESEEAEKAGRDPIFRFEYLNLWRRVGKNWTLVISRRSGEGGS